MHCVHIGIASLCSNEALLCSNTLNLSLEDVFTDVPHPQVRHVSLHQQACYDNEGKGAVIINHY